LCWFLDAGNKEMIRRLNWPASKKRQGTKSREVGQRLGGERYGDLMAAPMSMTGGTPGRCQLRICTYARWGECRRHFGWCSERIKVRSVH
jgi:hypothetical protein